MFVPVTKPLLAITSSSLVFERVLYLSVVVVFEADNSLWYFCHFIFSVQYIHFVTVQMFIFHVIILLLMYCNENG